MFKQLGLGAPTPISTQMLIADGIVKKPVGILYDVLVKVEKFIFLIYFMILDWKVNFKKSLSSWEGLF